MAQFVDHSLSASVFLPAGDDALVYGGYSTDGTINRNGVFLDRNGGYRAFSTKVGLVDVSAVATASVAYLAGRSCDGRADSTATGVACSPGELVMLRVDRATSEVSEVDLGVDFVDPSGMRGFVDLFLSGDGVVASIPGPDRSSLISIANGGTRTELKKPGGNLLCSSGSVLFAEAEPPTAVPEHEMLTDEAPLEPGKPQIVAMGIGDADWEPVPDPPRGPAGIRGCSKDHLFQLPSESSDPQSVAVYDPANRQWATTKDVAVKCTPYPLVNPETPQFVTVHDGFYDLVDPSTAEIRSFPSPAGSRPTGSPDRILLSDLSIVSVGASLRLEAMD